MILLFIYQCFCYRPDQYQFNITSEATKAYFHQANDNIFFQIPLPRLAFLVHSTENVIISVNVNIPYDNKHPNNPDFSNIKHMGFVGPLSRSFGVFFGDNTGSISVHCNNDTLFSFSTIFIPPECDIVHISSSPVELLDIYSKTFIEKKMGRDTLDPNKTICIWHSTLHTVNTTIEANGVNESNGLVLDYVTPTSNYQYNINTDICDDLPKASDLLFPDKNPKWSSNNFIKNNISAQHDKLLGKRKNNWRNSSSFLPNRKMIESNNENFKNDNNENQHKNKYDDNNTEHRNKDDNNDEEHRNKDNNEDHDDDEDNDKKNDEKDECNESEDNETENTSESDSTEEYTKIDDDKDEDTDKKEDDPNMPPPIFPNIPNFNHIPIECSTYFHYGWFNNTYETPPLPFPTEPPSTPTQSLPIQTSQIPTETQIPSRSPSLSPTNPPTKSPTFSKSPPTPTKSRHPTKTATKSWSRQPSRQPHQTWPPSPFDSPHPTLKPPPFYPKPPHSDFFSQKKFRSFKIQNFKNIDENGTSTILNDNNHQGNTFIFMRVDQDIKIDASILVKIQTNLLNNETFPNFKEFRFHSKIIPGRQPQFLIDEQNFPTGPGNNDFMPPHPDFEPEDEDDYRDPNKKNPNGGKFLIFGDKILYKQFRTIVIFQFVACLICMIIIIACIIYILTKKKRNELSKIKHQLILKEQREIEFGVKKRPHVPQANNPLPSILVEQLPDENNNDKNQDKNEWTLDEFSDASVSD